MFDVVCVGIIVADVIVQTVDELPPKGKLNYQDNISLYSGGGAMSGAVDLSVLGAKSAVIAKIGNDSFGDFLKNELVRKKVDITGLKISEYPTASTVVLVDSTAERTFMHCPGADAYFTYEDIDWEVIGKGRFVFATGMPIMERFNGQPCADFLKKCREMGKITMFDPAWDPTGEWMKKLAPCMPHIDFFMPSLEEAEQLSGETGHKKIADIFFDMGVKHVVIKLGKDGCYLRESKLTEGKYFPTYANVKPVDTTGAGDSFCAGFLFGLSRNYNFDECCRIGNAVGSHCVMKTGATAGIAPFEQIQKFMKENERYLV